MLTNKYPGQEDQVFQDIINMASRDLTLLIKFLI